MMLSLRFIIIISCHLSPLIRASKFFKLSEHIFYSKLWHVLLLYKFAYSSMVHIIIKKISCVLNKCVCAYFSFFATYIFRDENVHIYLYIISIYSEQYNGLPVYIVNVRPFLLFAQVNQ